jgi:hypothetical protein
MKNKGWKAAKKRIWRKDGKAYVGSKKFPTMGDWMLYRSQTQSINIRTFKRRNFISRIIKRAYPRPLQWYCAAMERVKFDKRIAMLE